MPENTAQKETRHTDALRVWRPDVRVTVPQKAGIPGGLASGQMRPLLVTRSAGRQSPDGVRAPHHGRPPECMPGHQAPEPFLLLSPTVRTSQSSPSPSAGMRTPFSRWTQSQLLRGSPSPCRRTCQVWVSREEGRSCFPTARPVGAGRLLRSSALLGETRHLSASLSPSRPGLGTAHEHVTSRSANTKLPLIFSSQRGYLLTLSLLRARLMTPTDPDQPSVSNPWGRWHIP